MKKCPSCNRIYDDSQAFCLDDGTPLLTDSAADSQKTVLLPRKKNKLPIIFVGLLLLVGASVIGWLLLGSRADNANQNTRQVTVKTQTPTPMPTVAPPAETPSPLPSPSPSPTISPETNANVSTNSDTKPETAANSKPVDESSVAKQQPPSIMKIEDHSVAFALQQCRKSGTSITCDFSLTNKGQDRRFELLAYQSKLFDELGNGYRGSAAQVANQTGSSPEIGFISGVTAKAQMTFENIEPNAAKITLLNVGYSVGSDYNLTFKFRNVPLVISK